MLGGKDKEGLIGAVTIVLLHSVLNVWSKEHQENTEIFSQIHEVKLTFMINKMLFAFFTCWHMHWWCKVVIVTLPSLTWTKIVAPNFTKSHSILYNHNSAINKSFCIPDEAVEISVIKSQPLRTCLVNEQFSVMKWEAHIKLFCCLWSIITTYESICASELQVKQALIKFEQNIIKRMLTNYIYSDLSMGQKNFILKIHKAGLLTSGKQLTVFVASDKLWILREVLHFGKCASVNMKSVLLNGRSILRRLVVKNYICSPKSFLNIAAPVEIKMVKHKNMALTSFYKNTKNTSTHGKIFTKCLLNTGRSPYNQAARKRSPHNRVGPNNNNKSNLDETCKSWEE